MSTKRITASVKLTQEEYEKLSRLAKERGTTRHDLLRQAVRKLVSLPTVEDLLSVLS